MENVSVLSCFSTTDHPSIPSVISSCFHFSSFPCQFLSPRFHRTMMPFEGLCRSVSEPPSLFIPRGKLSFRTEEELDVRGKFVCTGSAALCSRHFIRGSSLPLLAKRSLKNRRRVVVNAQDEDPSNDDNASEGTMQIAVEQSKRVLALQKELLQQIAERRNLVSSFKDNLSNSAKKGKSFNASISSEEDQELEKVEDNSEVQNGDVNAAEKSSESLSTTASAGFLSKDKALPGAVSNGSISDAMQFSGRSAAMPSSSALTTPLSTPFVNNEDIRASVKEPKPEEENDVKTEIDIASGAGDAKPPPLAGPNVMNIIVVAAECAPWSKTGGLGDVVGSLPKALARRGHRVMVVVPRYGNYSEARAMGIYKRYNIDGQDMEVSFFHGYIDGVDFIFLESPQFRGFANNIYGGNREDILKRMVLFCKAAVEVPWHVPCGGACYGDGNLVFIANDWHTALLPVYLQAYYRDHGLMKFTRSVLVIHNMAHQGRGPLVDYRFLGLPEHYIENFRLYDPIGGEHMNIFMAGLKTAHRIVTVSHGYAWECQTLEGAWGLHDVIKENAWKLTGIVNGIDDNEWNPEADVHLKTDGYANYSIDTLETGKLACKAALQKELGLPVRSDAPLIGFIGRLDHQKGVDLIADAIPWMINQDMQLVMLGTGRHDLEDMLRSFEGKYHDKVRGWVGFSVRAAHCITAAADILLMPSRFEPCGLNQLYAMRYGTVPVVHAVGGLRDTVKPFDPFSESGLGWTFETAEAQRLIHSLSNALLTYRDFKKSWQGIQKRGMSQDLSWDNAAQQYEKVLVAAKYQW